MVFEYKMSYVENLKKYNEQVKQSIHSKTHKLDIFLIIKVIQTI